MDAHPDVSVVVAAFSGEPELLRCLESLAAQDVEAELVVASALDEAVLRRVGQRFPAARCLAAESGTGAAGLRALGAAAARGRLVVLTEDHCSARPGWLASLRAAHGAGHAVVGGAVENGRRSSSQGRALYWCEYAVHMPPLPEGPARWLSGVNVAYDREALWACRDTWREQFCEAEVHAALQRAGHALRYAPGAVVIAHLGFDLDQALRHLYQGGRRFGCVRRARSGRLALAAWRLLVPAVPALLLWRVAMAVLSRQPGDAGRLVLALPRLLSLLASWGAGEAAGYWSPTARA